MTVADKEREERFDALFRAYLPDMVAYCGWRSGCRADAQDAVAETFLVAWRKLDEVPTGDEARLWLYGAVRRVLANQARAGRRRTRLSVRVAEAAATDVPWVEEAEALQRATRVGPVIDRVHLALARLKPGDREVLLLAEWEGLTPSQIAVVMECPTVTARGRLFRARRRFRAAYEVLPESRAGAMSGAVPAPALDPCASPSKQGVVPCS